MNILSRSVTFSIPKEWIPRWELLINFQSDNEGEAMPLDRDPKEIQLWIDLNSTMDKNTTATPSDLVSLEAVRRIVDFMLPTSDAYLFYIHNDLESEQKRIEVYTLMGLSATSSDGPCMCITSTNPNARSIRFESALHRLMAARPSEESLEEADRTERHIASIRSKILKVPYMLLLGLLGRAAQLGNWTIDIMSIDWSILTNTLLSRDSIAAYKSLVEDDEETMKRLRLQNLPDVFRMTNLRILAGMPLVTPINNADSTLHSLAITLNILSRDVFLGHTIPIDAAFGLLSDLGDSSQVREDPLVIESTFCTTQHINFFLDLVDKQVDINAPEYLPGIAKYMLGLGPLLDTNSKYNDLQLKSENPLYVVILLKMIEYTKNRDITAGNAVHSSLCKTLAATMGTKYLQACVKCIVRILEHHNQVRDDGEYIRKNPHIMFNTWETRDESPELIVRRLKEQDERLDSFTRAALEFIPDDGSLTDFIAWPQ